MKARKTNIVLAVVATLGVDQFCFGGPQGDLKSYMNGEKGVWQVPLPNIFGGQNDFPNNFPWDGMVVDDWKVPDHEPKIMFHSFSIFSISRDEGDDKQPEMGIIRIFNDAGGMPESQARFEATVPIKALKKDEDEKDLLYHMFTVDLKDFEWTVQGGGVIWIGLQPITTDFQWLKGFKGAGDESPLGARARDGINGRGVYGTQIFFPLLNEEGSPLDFVWELKYWNIPAPAALPLLVLAGLTPKRRRRR